jgi:hypothetical protein
LGSFFLVAQTLLDLQLVNVTAIITTAAAERINVRFMESCFLND